MCVCVCRCSWNPAFNQSPQLPLHSTPLWPRMCLCVCVCVVEAYMCVLWFVCGLACIFMCVCLCAFVWRLAGFWLLSSPGWSKWKAEVWMTYLFRKNPQEMASMLLCCHIVCVHACVCVLLSSSSSIGNPVTGLSSNVFLILQRLFPPNSLKSYSTAGKTSADAPPVQSQVETLTEGLNTLPEAVNTQTHTLSQMVSYSQPWGSSLSLNSLSSTFN